MSFQDFFKNSVWEDFLSRQAVTSSMLTSMIVSLLAALALGLFIYLIYRRFFGGVVFSRSFATTLVGMCVLTCMVTLAISTNVVISLGMVGALSIVRYRTAVKDPMDLLYLFWAITAGITAGASLYALAAISSVVMVAVVWVLYVRQQSGSIFLMVAHYEGQRAGDEILRRMGGTKFQLKSTTLRKGVTEMIVEVFCKNNETAFVEKNRGHRGCERRDAGPIQRRVPWLTWRPNALRARLAKAHARPVRSAFARLAVARPSAWGMNRRPPRVTSLTEMPKERSTTVLAFPMWWRTPRPEALAETLESWRAMVRMRLAGAAVAILSARNRICLAASVVFGCRCRRSLSVCASWLWRSRLLYMSTR